MDAAGLIVNAQRRTPRRAVRVIEAAARSPWCFHHSSERRFAGILVRTNGGAFDCSVTKPKRADLNNVRCARRGADQATKNYDDHREHWALVAALDGCPQAGRYLPVCFCHRLRPRECPRTGGARLVAFEFADRVAVARLGPLIQPALRQHVRRQAGGTPSIRLSRPHLCAKPDRHYTCHGEQRHLRRA